jgi:putative ABC transport system permease protein
VVKTTGDPSAITSTLRAHVAELDSSLPLFEVTTLEESVGRTVSARRLASMLLLGFAVTALLLAAIGVYGVISLNVNNRTNEFGIRLALGAQPRDVLKMVVLGGLRVAAVGVAVGIAASLVLTRLMEKMLFGISPSDPLTFSLVTTILVLAALAASFIPARRATKVDPLIALRYE